jgi:hypothetical protein
MTAFVALKLGARGLNTEQRSSPQAQSIHAQEEYGGDSKNTWHKESWVWVGLFEKYHLRARSSGKEAGKFGVAEKCGCNVKKKKKVPRES